MPVPEQFVGPVGISASGLNLIEQFSASSDLTAYTVTPPLLQYLTGPPSVSSAAS